MSYVRLPVAWCLAGLLLGTGCIFDESGFARAGDAAPPTQCGDGVIEAGEDCDDGNGATNDGCSATCTVEVGWSCTGVPSNCVSQCGDGVIVGAEGCDDANTVAGDGCDDLCAVEPGWLCMGEPSACSLAVACGDGVIDGGEGCDDSNTAPGDGCDASCQVEPGWVCAGEPSDCSQGCGDGMVRGAETCDDANTNAGDGCDSGCQVEPGWQCTGEPSACTEVCGDGVVTTSELCDDGNLNTGDGCDDVCDIENGWTCSGQPSTCEQCGDGIIQGSESCDDLNTQNGDGCDDTCQIEPGYNCTGTPSVCALAGDTCADNPIQLSGSGVTVGTTSGFGNDHSGQGCGGLGNNSGGPDVVYELQLNAGDYLVARVVPHGGGTPWNAHIYLSESCPFNVSNCPVGWRRADDDGAPERLDYVAGATGPVYLIIDSPGGGDQGDFTLEYEIGGPVSAVSIPGDVIFTEVMPDPFVSDNDCEWFELYNTTGAALNLFDVTFENPIGTFDVVYPLVIRSGEHLVFAFKYSQVNNCGLDHVGYTYEGSGFDIERNQGSTYLRFQTGNSVEIDRINYGQPAASHYSDGHSMHLCTNHLTGTDNDNLANWAETVSPTPTYGPDGNFGTPTGANPGSCN